MKTLYHLTWDLNVPSILEKGLLPHFRPNQWVLDGAARRSTKTTFLCCRDRMAAWDDIYGGGWARKPSPEGKLVWLEVRVPAAWLKPDSAKGENYRGDFKCRRRIPAQHIRPCKLRLKTR